jgi:hypothetical protein
MRRIGSYNKWIIGLLFLLIACNSNKKKATVFLTDAQELYEQGEYEQAKNKIDSIKILFPKEFEIQIQGLEVKRRIEIKEQEQHLILCDSLLTVRLAEAETMKPGFLFEKDPAYDEVGKYIDRSQRVEARLERSHIRTSVNELGEILFSSVYYGGRPIQHSHLMVSKSNGEFAETQVVPYDGGLNYSFVDEGMTTEIITYTRGRDNGVIRFIYNNRESALKAEYIGNVNYSFTIPNTDKNALVKTVDLATVLSDIEKLKKEIERSTLRLMYLNNRLTGELPNISE